MDDLVAAPRGGTRHAQLRRLVPPLVLISLVAGCGAATVGAPTASGPHQALAADLGALRASDGLLYPPELWGALSPSPRSEVLRNTALRALGEPVVWSLPPRELYHGLTQETDELTAASLMAEAGLAPLVPAPVIKSWVAGSQQRVTDPDVLDRLWKAATVARHANVDVELSSGVAAGLGAMITDPSPMIQRKAFDILAAAGAAPTDVPTSETWRRRVTSRSGVSDPQVLVQDLYSWVTLHRGPHGLAVDRSFWQPILDWVSTSDDIYAYGVRAFVAAGNASFAREIAARFDRRRLLDGGRVLEPAIFSGSLGSTFRMIRFLHESPAGVGPLGDPGGLIATVRPMVSRDLSHRLAGTAAMYLLRPDTVAVGDRRALIAAASTQMGVVSGRPMSTDATMAWLSLAEHATVLDVPIDFPGISPDALDMLLGPRDDALYAVARLLLALDASAHQDSPQVDLLADHLARSLTGRDIAEVNSLLLFAGSLALREIVGVAPYPESQLAEESRRRRGQCLGGFQTFVREHRTPNTACNVEATRYVNAL